MFQFFKYPQTDLNQQNLDWMIQTIKTLQKQIGAGGVKVIDTTAEMTDVNVIYVYVGSEPGMATDHWYYYDTDTSSWVDGGSWGGASVNLPLAITDGGTGATTVAGARNALGLGNTAGALPIANGGTGSHTAADAYTALGGGAAGKLDTVDIAHGGTGAATVEDARNALGLGHTAGALPIANGGTGAVTAAAARTALGITPAIIGAVPTSDLPLSIANGGTASVTAEDARTALGITPANIGAEPAITALPVSKGGTSATNAATALANLLGYNSKNATYTAGLSVGDYKDITYDELGIPAGGTLLMVSMHQMHWTGDDVYHSIFEGFAWDNATRILHTGIYSVRTTQASVTFRIDYLYTK